MARVKTSNNTAPKKALKTAPKKGGNLLGKRKQRSFLSRIMGNEDEFRYFISISIGSHKLHLKFDAKTEKIRVGTIKVGVSKFTSTNAGNSESIDNLRITLSCKGFNHSVVVPPSCFKMDDSDHNASHGKLEYTYTISNPIIIKSSCGTLSKVINVDDIPQINQTNVIGQNSPY